MGHGTWESGDCCELVADFGNTNPNSSSCMCGDFVPDTPADIGTNITNSTCQWAVPTHTVEPTCTSGSYPNYVDGNGDPYQPNADNIMSSTNDNLDCTTVFTAGQARRMRYILETELLLQSSHVTPQMTNPEINGIVQWTTSNTPSNGDFLIDGNLTIKSGSVLSIQSGVVVHFGENGKVIIEPNAQLELRGKLTSSTCGTYWQGVEVWGNPTQPQWPTSASPLLYPQGFFWGRPGGVVENAVTALNLWQYGTGGVVLCDGTTFKNAVHGIIIGPFFNFFPPFNIPLPYSAVINNSTFEVDGDYPHNADFHSFVYMSGVNGPRFSNCSFSNNLIYSIFVPTVAEDHGYGIFAFGSGFTVNNGSTFNKLGYGIYTGTLGTQLPFTVENSTFDQCIIAIRDKEVSGATIVSNTFNMGTKPNLYSGDQFGICFEEDITSFTCQENNFTNTAGNNYHQLIGIFCKNTGDMSKAIRKNSFTGLDIGNLSNGTNGNSSLQFPRGLIYLCNTNTNAPSSTDFDVANGQIRPIQGFPNVNSGSGHDATGNTFSYTGTDFNNAGGNITYYYDPISADQTPIGFLGNFNPDQANTNNCPSEFFEMPPMDTQVVNDIKQQYYDTQNDYTRLESIYQTNPTDAIADTMNFYRWEMDMAATAVISHIKTDTLSLYDPDSLFAWISHLESFEGDLWLAREHLALGDPVSAAQVFNNIPSRHSLTAAQSADLNNYSAIANLIGTQSVYDLDTTTLSAIRNYDHVGGHAEGWAQNILTWYGDHYPVEYVTSSQGGQELIRNDQMDFQQATGQGYRLSVFPNPARNEVNFSLTGKMPIEEVSLAIRDIHGRTVAHSVFDSPGYGFLWDSSNIPAGVYFFRLYSKGGIDEAGKIILDK